MAADGATFQDVAHFSAGICARRRNLYYLELSRWSRTKAMSVPAEPPAADGAHPHTNAGVVAGGRVVRKRNSAHPGAGISSELYLKARK